MKTNRKKILIGAAALALLFLSGFLFPKVRASFPWNIGSALPPFQYTYINTNNSTTSVKVGQGELNTLVIETAAANSVITLYDSATTTYFGANTTATGTITIATSSTATTTELAANTITIGASSSTLIQEQTTATITIGNSSTQTSTATGVYSVQLNGAFISSTSTPVGSTTVNAATNLVTAINLATSTDGNLSATSTNNVITVTASSTGANQFINYNFPTNPQNGLLFSGSSTQGDSGVFSASVNGVTINSAILANQTSTIQAAIALTTAINAVSSTINGITATSSLNVITLTASTAGTAGNFSVSFPRNPQNNVTLTTAPLTVGASGIFSATINGVLVNSTTTANGTSSVVAAVNLTTAINAASSSIAGITATSTSNVITLTALTSGANGSFGISFPSNPQNGMQMAATSTPGNNKTITIAQITLPATTTYYNAPVDANYQMLFNNGLVISQTGGTSTFTATWY